MGLWKDMFGESYAVVWKRLADELGGMMVDRSWTRGAVVHARLGGFDIALDTYTVSTGKSSVTYTRLRAPFVNARGLRFTLYRASIFTGLAKMLGTQDLEIGVPDFDRDFVIQGNDPTRIAQILADPALRALIIAQPRIRVSIADDEGMFERKYGDGVDVLTFVDSGIIRDIHRLRGLFSLLAALLHAFRAGAQHFLEVPAAELPSSFQQVVDHIVDPLGGRAERVGDAVEARLSDPLGIGLDAQASVTLPQMPALATTMKLRAALPPGAAFAAEKRGLLARGALDTGDAAVDAAFAIRGDVAQVSRALRPLARLAATPPRIEVTTDSLVVDAPDLPADRLPSTLGAALDLWQELVRHRSGL
jgi:hypothetical protein